MSYIFLITAIILNSAANFLLKLGSQDGFLYKDVGFIEFFQKNAHLLFGLVLFALNVIFYFVALKKLPLSVAYPVMVGGTFLIVNLAAVFGLGEYLSWQHLLGYALILAGVTLVSIV